MKIYTIHTGHELWSWLTCNVLKGDINMFLLTKEKNSSNVFFFYDLLVRKKRKKTISGFVIAQAPRACDIMNVINIVTFSHFNYVSIEARVAS
jgi:hypothetical protein